VAVPLAISLSLKCLILAELLAEVRFLERIRLSVTATPDGHRIMHIIACEVNGNRLESSEWRQALPFSYQKDLL